MRIKGVLIAADRVTQSIHLFGGQKVLLSSDPAELYDVPADFVFQLSAREFENLKSQFVTSSWGGLRRARPYAFTEQGVAMLSSVLKSRRHVREKAPRYRTGNHR